MVTEIKNIQRYLIRPVSIAPLVIFRIAFGALLFLSTLRFILKGWVYQLYVAPKFFFPYYGFEWVKPFNAIGMYIVFGLMLLGSLGIIFGFFYRYSSTLFFILFTYVELIDKTNYLNHYYFVSLMSFIVIFLPAAHDFSLDVRWRKKVAVNEVPQFYESLIKLQLFLVYLFAGIAKLNYDWLFEAQPLKIWLPAFSHWPLVGRFMELDVTAYLFCWFGCVYDLCIGFLLFNKRVVYIAYVFVIIFHLATALFFNIGMFPYIMITSTCGFFKAETHLYLLQWLKKWTKYNSTSRVGTYNGQLIGRYFFIAFFFIQIILPFRYVCYPGKLFWTEQGYRFSWRVMLMEKAGTAFFYVRDAKSGKETEVDNKKYLTYMQEKQMATQPDMMVDYAKFLKLEFMQKGYTNPSVRAQTFVTLNGAPSKPFIDSQIDLSAQSNSFLQSKNWILPY
jgi:hypothetical protein